MGLPQIEEGKAPGMDLVEPEIDFVGLAQSFGVKAHRVTEPDDLCDRLREAVAGDVPVLLDVRIER
jgi:thiamine pyrophosphate-dependent acetolactate synthase large subunit-like protein